MPRNTAMMVHNAAWGVYGNSKELRKSADDLDIINGAMLQSYIVKAGDKLPAEKLEELTDGETWLSAEMCIQYGLADEYAEQARFGLRLWIPSRMPLPLEWMR